MKTIYIKTNLTSVINITKIVTVYDYSYDETFVFAGEKHDFWELVYVEKGSIMITADHDESVLGEGDIVFHAPNEFHAIRAYRSCPHYYVVSFVCNSEAMSFFRRYITNLSESLKDVFMEIIDEAKRTYVVPSVYRGGSALERRENAEIGGDQMIKTGLERFLIKLIRDSEVPLGIFRTRKDMEEQLVYEVKEYIGRHICEKLTVPAVCRYINYSKTYLCRVFREVTGDTVSHYVNVQKIEYAKRKIRYSDTPFFEISDTLSFDNPQYFSRVFKRIAGISPSEYRQTCREKQENDFNQKRGGNR